LTNTIPWCFYPKQLGPVELDECISMGKLDKFSNSKETARHRLAMERYQTLKLFDSGEISSDDAMATLQIKKSRFYKILSIYKRNKNHLALVPEMPGPPAAGYKSLPPRIESIIEDMYQKHYGGASASFMEVWRQVQLKAQQELVPCPSYHAVRERITAKKEAERFLKKHGREAANQKYGVKTGRKECIRPLEWVQIDHTLVDLILVRDDDRSKIIGRPWITLAICLYTRAIVGFHISLLPPSAVSVAMVIANAASSKKTLLEFLDIKSDLLPMFGKMETVHTDNAKEFVSDLLRGACMSHGIDLKQRPIGKKHFGGHIERLIGTMMTTRVHFYKGTTLSNIRQRRGTTPESAANLTFREFFKIMVLNIKIYHDTQHSALKMSPSKKWDNYFQHHPLVNQITENEVEAFRLDFFPEEIRKVHPYGLELLNRRYYDSKLADYVGAKVLVKFDPYDLSHVYVLIKAQYEKVSVSHNSANRSDVFEQYRHQRTCSGLRPGTITTAEALNSLDEINGIRDKAENQKKTMAKEARRHLAERKHSEYKDTSRGNSLPEPTKPKNGLNKNIDLYKGAQAHSLIDFSTEPTLYEVERK
jgi:putative transposase